MAAIERFCKGLSSRGAEMARRGCLKGPLRGSDRRWRAPRGASGTREAEAVRRSQQEESSSL